MQVALGRPRPYLRPHRTLTTPPTRSVVAERTKLQAALGSGAQGLEGDMEASQALEANMQKELALRRAGGLGGGQGGSWLGAQRDPTSDRLHRSAAQPSPAEVRNPASAQTHPLPWAMTPPPPSTPIPAISSSTTPPPCSRLLLYTTVSATVFTAMQMAQGSLRCWPLWPDMYMGLELLVHDMQGMRTNAVLPPV